MKHQVFYEVGAQVLPVLWIVLVFQLRLFGTKAEEDGIGSIESDDRHRSMSTIGLVLIVFTGTVMWIGEGTAINALLGEDDTGFSRAVLSLALTIGTLWVFFVPVFPWIEALLERTPLEPVRQRWFGWLKSRRGDD